MAEKLIVWTLNNIQLNRLFWFRQIFIVLIKDNALVRFHYVLIFIIIVFLSRYCFCIIAWIRVELLCRLSQACARAISELSSLSWQPTICRPRELPCLVTIGVGSTLWLPLLRLCWAWAILKLLLCFHIFIWFFLQDLIVFMNQFVKASFLYLETSFWIFVFSQEFLMMSMFLFFGHQSLVDVHWSNSTDWSCWCCACCMLILKLFGHFDFLTVNSSWCQDLASFLGCSSLTLQNLQVLSLLFCQTHLVF